MDISKLLNPVQNKKPRFDEDTLVGNKYWLPTELIAYIISFFLFNHRPKFQLVSKQWCIAYEQYHRNRLFNDYEHVKDKNVTREQVLKAFVKYGHRLRWLFINTSTLREILEIEPNFADLVPNVIWLSVTVNDGFSSQRWIGDFLVKLRRVGKILIEEFGFTADEHLAGEMEKVMPVLPRLQGVDFSTVDLDFTAFPGPNMKERASQIEYLGISVASAEPESIASAFVVFKNVAWLSFTGISSVNVLKVVTEMVVDSKNFPKLNRLEVYSELDLSHVDPIVNEEGGTTITAMDLYLKICGIRRPQCVIRVGFILGACSKTHPALIEREREFVINLGKIGADVLSRLELTHYTPVGDYDPLTTLFYESAPRFPKLRFMSIYASPTAATGPRIIEALNNSFLLPYLEHVLFYVDGMQPPEWNEGFNPIDPSRGVICSIIDAQHEDEARMFNENNDGAFPSWFLADDTSH
ncbi:hypothetical protein GQ42DRAFT_53995 [Ramicandelaber brevisporus]|nr:hypothetical protein GQ42DRAFT_53995 [Ramicandelaber brevisporus]